MGGHDKKEGSSATARHDDAPEKRRRRGERARLELGMVLRADVERVRRAVELDDLHPLARGVAPDEAEPGRLQSRAIVGRP